MPLCEFRGGSLSPPASATATTRFEGVCVWSLADDCLRAAIYSMKAWGEVLDPAGEFGVSFPFELDISSTLPLPEGTRPEEVIGWMNAHHYSPSLPSYLDPIPRRPNRQVHQGP